MTLESKGLRDNYFDSPWSSVFLFICFKPRDAIIAFYQQIASGKLVHLECEVKTYLFVLAKRYLIKAVEKNGRTESLDVHKMSLHEMETSMEFDWDDPLHFQKRQVASAMQTLGVQCKELLNLKFLEELSLDEIMLKKGYSSPNATSASISRCLRNLKDLIKDTLQNDR
ncbi:MAG: sigma-70 family RNA polymerase sigma factor [Saprospiraceae bacterium]|nr:sigma-70 family RNA polymerase sigma factor [Saprospiraceae bacterium]